jgi:hypothetical protein
MPTLETVLKTKGYSDDDLKGMETLLKDPKFRTALEGSFSELESERDKLKGDNEVWARWHQETAQPMLDAAFQREQKAREEAATAAARLQTLQDQGLLKQAEQQDKPPDPKPEPSGAFDPKAYKLVTQDDVARFAEAEGQAIAMAADLAAQFQELHGKSLYSYQSPDGGRGLSALRREAVAARKPLDAYVAEKFNFAAKRAELDAAEKARYEDGIRKDERAKAIAEFANPSARAPQDSRMTLVPRVDKEGKQPWEKPEGSVAQVRVAKAVQHILQ